MRRSGKKLLRIALGGMMRECNRQITSVCTVRDLLDGSLFPTAHLKRIFSDDKCRRRQRLRQVQESGKGPWPALSALDPLAEAETPLQRGCPGAALHLSARRCFHSSERPALHPKGCTWAGSPLGRVQCEDRDVPVLGVETCILW